MSNGGSIVKSPRVCGDLSCLFVPSQVQPLILENS